ncbi:hypothetical protein VW35_01160 [Devosia soli]|uniref:Solute-binding protein family 5 domain-containing protein n=1 Tax=Devosia soli TaxID=361041 RepID=A0A0F5LEM0_9HYPH|nr:peptide ABC transporter substrate-binding protein [Devosia soli]KKB80841.1 hypothetical protein VW35_01160 [Devosia soli]
MTSLVRAALLALGCFSSAADPALAVSLTLAHTPETISVYPTAFGPIDPLALVDCFEGLVASDARGEAIPGQAASWTISPDGTVYTFTLRDEARWSDGSPVIADDFLAAFQWLFDPANAFEFAYLQFPIRHAAAIAAGTMPMADLGVRVLGEKRVEITLEHAAPFFLQTLTHSTAYPVPSAVLAARGRAGLKPEDLRCNGPFTITKREGERTTAVKSEHYYASADVAVEEVNYLAVSDVPSALEQFKNGEIDMFYDLPVSANAWIDANAAVQSQVVPFLGLAYLALNLDKPPFDQKALRRALSMAIDRGALDPQGVHSPRTAAYGIVPEGTANYEGVEPFRPEWADWPLERRVVEASTTMASLGYTVDKPLNVQIRYIGTSSDVHQKVAQQIAEMWCPIGVDVELFSASADDHYRALKAGDFDIGRLSWILDVSDPANILELMSSTSEFNSGRYSDGGVDALLAEANGQTDFAERARILARVEARLVDDTAIIPLHWIVVRNLVGPGLSGIEDNAKNIHPTRWVSKAPAHASN